jgi:hypothetical protein
MTESITIRFQLVHNNKVIRSFDVDVPEYVYGVESDSEYLRALIFYNRIQKVMEGHVSMPQSSQPTKTEKKEKQT